LSQRSQADGLIVLLTDFGVSDPYVGVMKGAIASVNPDLRVIDLTHEIAPHDICCAAFFLAQSGPHFPQGTTFIVVVDPGAGSDRRGLIVRTQHATLAGPDNGVLIQGAGDAAEIHSLTETRWHGSCRSHTFPGRDVFAPVGAHAAGGTPPGQFGSLVRDPVHLPESAASRVICIDRFGNAVTDVRPDAISAEATVRCGEFEAQRVSLTYATANPGDALAFVNSYGLVELAVNQGNAAESLRISVGDRVYLEDVY